VTRGARAFEHHKGNDRFTGHIVRTTHHCGFVHQIGLAHQRRLDFHRAHTVAGDVEHIVDTPCNAEISPVCAAHSTVTSEVVAFEFFREIALFEALGIAPNGADHGWPWFFHHKNTARTVGYVLTRLVNDAGIDARQWQGAGTWHQRRGTRQGRDHVATRLGLPERVEHRAPLTAHVFEIPHPGFRVDGLTHRTQDTQTGEVGARRVHFLIGLGG